MFTDEAGVIVGYGHASPLDASTAVAGFVRADRPRASVRAYPWPETGGFVPGLVVRGPRSSTGRAGHRGHQEANKTVTAKVIHTQLRGHALLRDPLLYKGSDFAQTDVIAFSVE